jgi:hypothetical protein
VSPLFVAPPISHWTGMVQALIFIAISSVALVLPGALA